MHRRQLLSGLGAAAGVSLLGTACGSGDGLPAADAPQTLFVQQASIEYLAGADRWVAFGVRGSDNVPLDDAELQVWLRTVGTVDNPDPEVVVGPLDATFSPAVESGQGIYYVRTDLPEAGFLEIVAKNGDDHGVAAIQVVDPVDSQIPIPGAEAISAQTATTADDMGVFSVCTQQPPCGMHEMSLDGALETGRPVVMMFATPEFCQTAVCGPSVSTLDQVRESGDWGETIFVHSEIFAEAPVGASAPTTPLVPAVEAWGLPSEPWLFTIDGDGVIAGRLDGPMPEPIITAMLEELTA